MNVDVNVNVIVIVNVIGFGAEGVGKAAEQHDAEEANALLEHVVAMLTRMCR